jgi:hypothetical protein
MTRTKGWRPSPGIVIGIVALVAAVAGTAVAGPGAETSAFTKAKAKKIAKKVANKQITKRAPTLAVGSAQVAGTLTQASRDAEIALGASTDFTPILQQTVPAGSYLILGKTVLNNNTAGATRRDCRLTAEGDFDRAAVSIDDGAGIDEQRTVAMHLAHTFAATGTITLACEGGANVVMASDRKIHAYRVNAITSDAGTGP